jgi:hypothetical protein
MILKAIVFDQGDMLWHFSLDGGWQSILLADAIVWFAIAQRGRIPHDVPIVTCR